MTDIDPEDLELEVEEALVALDDGDPADALARLDALPAAEPLVALARTEVLLELGRLDAAAAALEAGDLEPDDPDRLWLEGQVLLRRWRLGEAERAFGELADAEESSAALCALALCRELDGDLAGADAYLRAASEVDPVGSPLPVRFTTEQFDRVVQEALSELPDEFQSVIGSLRFLVEPMPSRSLVRAGDEGATPPDLLGLFCGPTLGELGDGGLEVPVVYLFQRNIERVARDEDELRLEIRTTLYHEIGHFLGHDEHGVEAMGLG